MAVERTGPDPDAAPLYARLRRAVHVLFPEARRLERRRRLRVAVLALLVAAAVFGFLRASWDVGRGAPAVGRPSFAVASVALPRAGEFSSIAVVGRRLIVTGGPTGSLVVSGYWNLLIRGRAPGICDAATVDPTTLSLGDVTRANCGNPALYGERVLPISYGLRNPRGTSTIAVRIARADPAARDGYELGPVVTRYPECSDCQIAWVYGGGSLWLYNPLAAYPPRHLGVLLRISARTGAVLERWPMPQIVRALLAADAHSLWLAPSIQSGTPGGVTGSQLAPYISLYRITRGRRSPQRVFSVGGSGARWLVASGDDASAAIDNGRGKAAVWTFSANAAPVHGKPLNFLRVGTELGTGSPTVAGDPKTGFYNVLTSNGIEKVVHVQPSGRGQELVATIRAPNVTPADGFAAGVTFDGSFYFLDPPADARSGQVRLHRITPR